MAQPSYSAFGYTTTIDTSLAPIMSTVYTEQTTDAQRSLVSSDPNDAAGGTGARSVRLTYYDTTLAGPFFEDVTLNGLGPVNTINSNICFIESIEVLTVGAQRMNVGTIMLKAGVSGGGATIGSIVPGDNRTQWAHHYVAKDRAARISSIVGGILGIGFGEVHMRRSTPTIAGAPDQNVAPVLLVPPNGQEQLLLTSPIVVFGPSRIVLYARSRISRSQDWQASFGFEEQ
jgi:hypothetical protein